MILHHYAFSPFGEKIRGMFGATGLQWRSVIVPPQPPRPSLAPLISGYRKSPIAQIGADLYCDTRAISDEIARRTARPELSPLSLSDEERTYQEHVEGPIFFACLTAIPKTRMLWKLVTTLGWSLPRFVMDRARLGAAGGVDAPSAAKAAESWQAHLADLNQRVARGYLGGERPNHLDFACYHSLWFFELMSGTVVAQGLDPLARWQRNLRDLGHGQSVALDAPGALAIARDSAPLPIDDAGDDPNLGRPVTVTPTDYGRDATDGVLVASTADRWVLARETSACGRVHLHFPRRGFTLTTADATP